MARAFLLAIARPPERRRARRRRWNSSPRSATSTPGAADAEQKAWADFCQMLLASNAFLVRGVNCRHGKSIATDIVQRSRVGEPRRYRGACFWATMPARWAGWRWRICWPTPRRWRGPSDARPTHAAPKAKSVICLFQHGGPSQMDLFDPKPELTKYHGKPYPAASWKSISTSRRATCWARRSSSSRCGQSGMELCELLPHTAGVADDLTLVRSMNTESVDHEAALRLIHTGKFLAGRPSWGSWVVYGLGSENRNLPAYVVLSDPGGLPVDGERNWSAGWLPAVYQGTPFRSGKSPVLEPANARGHVGRRARATSCDFSNGSTARTSSGIRSNTELEARLANFETAARMQTAVPDVLDLSQRDGRDAQLCTASTTRPRPNMARAACWPGGWSSGACASCRSS